MAVNRSNFSGRKDRGRTFWSNCRDRMECGRILSHLYGSVASLPSPSSNIEAWPYGTSLRFAPAFRALGVCEHIWLRYKNFDPSCFDPIQKTWYVDLRTNWFSIPFLRPTSAHPLNTSLEQRPDTGQFAEKQLGETQFAECKGQFAVNYSTNCLWVNFRQIVPYSLKWVLNYFTALTFVETFFRENIQ